MTEENPCVYFNVFIICNHKKGTSMEMRSFKGGEGSGVGVVTVGRKCVRVFVCFIVSPLTVFL